MPRLDGHDPAAVARAADAIAAGALVAFPTETVYGLGARADDPDAVGSIFQAKGRPSDHPLIVHVLDAEAASMFSASIGLNATRLMARFWPGALTIIVMRRDGVADAAAGHQTSIALRSPDHPVARSLLAAAKSRGVHGIAAPSANRFGRVSPTTAAHVLQEFGAELLVLDGGACAVGIESTIIDCSRDDRPALRRPGMVGRREVEAVLGQSLHLPDADSPRASGTLEAHYAPTARLRLMDSATLRLALGSLADDAAPRVAVYSRFTPCVPGLVAERQMPATAAATAQELFAVMRAFDDAGASEIWVECPEALPEWEGVNDRLRRAAAA